MMMSIKEKIISSINYVREQLGFTLCSEDWGMAHLKCTCAMGCVILQKNPNDQTAIENWQGNAAKVAEMLGVSELWVDQFIDGFDSNGSAKEAKIPLAWELGAEVAKETKPVKYSTLSEY
jgi:hypothetical protein